MVKYSFSANRIVYQSFLNINLSVSVSYAVDKLHAHATLLIHVRRSQTRKTIWQNRDLDPCLRKRQRAIIELLPSAFKPFSSEVKCFFFFLLRDKGAKSKLHYAIRVCHKHGFKSTFIYLLLVKPTTGNFLRLFAVCSRTCNFLRLLVDRILNSLPLELFAEKAQFNFFLPLAAFCATSCACIIFGLYCSSSSFN